MPELAVDLAERILIVLGYATLNGAQQLTSRSGNLATKSFELPCSLLQPVSLQAATAVDDGIQVLSSPPLRIFGRRSLGSGADSLL